jgi:hypothetical protein
MSLSFRAVCYSTGLGIEFGLKRYVGDVFLLALETAKMSSEERDQGRKWVESEIAKIAVERGLTLSEPVEWHKDFDHMVYWIEAEFDGTIKRWKFSYEQLEDCVNDKRVRRELEKAIGFLVPRKGSPEPGSRPQRPDIPQTEPAATPTHTPRVHDKPRQDDEGKVSRPTVETENTSQTVFISYSHKDPDPQWLARVRANLRPLERRGLRVQIWDDSHIQAGMKWHREIESALQKARIALLLISANFFESDFIWTNELPPLLYAAENHGTVVLPLIVSASRFLREPELARYQAINDPKKPLDRLKPGKQAQVLDDMASRIEALIFAPPNPAESNDAAEVGSSLGQEYSASQVPADVAAALICKHAKLAGVQVGMTVKAPTSPFGTSSYRAEAKDGKGVIYCHADGPHRAAAFYVRKGVGWFYERVLLGVSSRLGLPITNEQVVDETGCPTSRFEGGYIEWSPNTKVARAVIRSARGEQTLAERILL